MFCWLKEKIFWRKTRKRKIYVYKRNVAEYLKKCSVIEGHIQEIYASYGDDCQGTLDWAPHELQWEKETEEKLDNMAHALNLTGEEIEKIWKSAKIAIL